MKSALLGILMTFLLAATTLVRGKCVETCLRGCMASSGRAGGFSCPMICDDKCTKGPVSATTETTTTPAPFTDAPYRIGAVKEQKEMDTDSLPMTVLIVMLVLISILLFLAVFLLLHRYRSRCQKRDEELYRPPAYCMAPEHHLDWGDSSTLKSKVSARTINSRSHYSIAAHHLHMPLPPIPHSTAPRRGKTYRRPPSVGSSVKVPYVQPQDAIGQASSEDGEIAALSSGSPKVHYKSSPDRRVDRIVPCTLACRSVQLTNESRRIQETHF